MLTAAIFVRELLPPGHRLLHSQWEGNADRAWALSLLLLGLLLPIAYFAWRRKYRT